MFKPDLVKNSKFNLELAEEQFSKLLTQWWFLNSHKGLAYSKADLYELYSAKEMGVRLLQEKFDRMIDEAKLRKEVSERFVNWNVVSIGEDCFSRSIATRWGMRRSAEHGGKSGPFDLSVHPPGSLAKIIEDDFDGYLDPVNLTYQSSMSYCRNSKLGVVFNHETGPEWAENNFSKLIETIDERVRRFKDVLNSTDDVCFVLHIGKPSAEKWSGVRNLVDAILKRSKSPGLMIVCVATWEAGSKILPKSRGSYQDMPVYFIDRHYPFEGYVWHRDNRTQEGYIFEREIVERFLDVLASHTKGRKI